MNVDILVDLMNQLTQGAETFLHSHPRHVMDADDVFNFQRARVIKRVTGDYVVRPNDEIVEVDGSATVRLPHSEFNKEFQIVKASAAGSLTVVPTAPDTILGGDGVTVGGANSSLNFKMDSVRSNWILI